MSARAWRQRKLGAFTVRCTKVPYRDEIAAKLAMAGARRKDGSRRVKIEQRAYRCPVCQYWHLTSRK